MESIYLTNNGYANDKGGIYGVGRNKKDGHIAKGCNGLFEVC